VGGSVARDKENCCIVLDGDGVSEVKEKVDWNYVMIGMTCSFYFKVKKGREKWK